MAVPRITKSAPVARKPPVAALSFVVHVRFMIAPSLSNLPLTGFARRYARVDPGDAAVHRDPSRGVLGVAIDPVKNLDAAARRAGGRAFVAGRELQRPPGLGLGIQPVDVHVDRISRQGKHRGRRHARRVEICRIRILVGLSHDLRLDGVLPRGDRSEEHTSELQSLAYLVCRLLLEKKKKRTAYIYMYAAHRS